MGSACPSRGTRDDLGLRTFYRSVLAAEGYSVVSVEDGLDALHRIELEPPDVVILDLALPRLGGRDVQRELASHAETRHIPIMVVSGTETRDLDPAAYVCVLRKPVSADALIAAVQNCLRRPRDSGDPS